LKSVTAHVSKDIFTPFPSLSSLILAYEIERESSALMM